MWTDGRGEYSGGDYGRRGFRLGFGAPAPLPIDRTPPTLNVTEPQTTSISTRKPRFTLQGTTTDNVTPTRAQFRVRKPGSSSYGAWATINLPKGSANTKNWSRTVALNRKGDWLVQMRVLDTRGNTSSTRTITIKRR
jgi:hypothetical protein